MKCRHCATELQHVFVDLGHQPPSNAYLPPTALGEPEVYAPLKTYVCSQCWLVQLPAHHRADELFTSDYAYFSSVSSTWLEHARRYVADMTSRFGLGAGSFVVEVASNDGYLLQYVRDAGMPCLGIEPTASTAAAARAKGIKTIEAFFGEAFARELASTRGHADLIAANNVLAHVPDIDDFVAGFRELLAAEGVATFEFPSLVNLVEGVQFDTIYHEHYSYLSLTAVNRILAAAGLRVFDVETLPTHGGSLRVFACRATAERHARTEAVEHMLADEARRGVASLGYYGDLQRQALAVKRDLVSFLVEQKRAGRKIAAYGAAAKGNTLLNFCGIKRDLIEFVCDAAPSKQGRFLPGSHIPIRPPSALTELKPDFVLILPWNIRREIEFQNAHIRVWGGRFVVAVPKLEVA